MAFKQIAAKITSVALIIFSLYQMVFSLNAIFFIYPHLSEGQNPSYNLQQGLIEKAIVLYVTMITSGIFGFILFFKPAEKVKTIHILLGIIVFAISAYFSIQTPFSTDPLSRTILNMLNSNLR
jgi:hypothetical protein